MKKRSFLFGIMLVLVLFFSSCCDDEDSPVSIKGKWNFDKMSVKINEQLSPELDYEGNESGCSKDYIEFVVGGVFNEGDFSGSDCGLNISKGTWLKNKNVVIITSEGIAKPFEVTSLSGTKLKLKYSEIQNGMTTIINLTFIKA